MKSIFYLLLLSVVFYSCCDCPEVDVVTAVPEQTNDSIVGSFIRVADNDRAGAKDSLFPIDGLTIKGGHAQFIYDGTPMSGTCEVDSNFVYINTATELGILGFEIMNEDRLEGEGFAHGSFARSGGVVMAQEKDDAVDPEPTIQQNVAASTSQPTSSTSSTTAQTNTSSSSNTQTTTTTPKVTKPSGSGSGTATGSANGPTGVDTGEDSPIRTRLSDVNVSGVKSSTDETITLQIAIDGAGNVTKASVIKSKTTTKDDALINEVISAVKKQVKYSRNTGASLKYEIYTVKVVAN